MTLLSPFFCAVSFLTQIPVPQSWYRHEDFSKTLGWFACVGWLLGGLTALVVWLPGGPHNRLLTGCVVLVVLQLLCGGFHMDGLADSADGLWSSRTRERMLEIMHDSRIGSMGVLSLIFVILTGIAAFTEIPSGDAWKAALLAPVAGRLLCVFHTLALPYARTDGLAAALFKERPYGAFIFHSILLCVVARYLLPDSGLTGCVSAFMIGAAWTFFCKQKLGGATGDTSGATVELSTTGFWIGMALAS